MRKKEKFMTNRSIAYAQNLSKLIQCETITVNENEDFSKFYNFHNVLQQVFPLVFQNCIVEKFGASLLLRWKGQSAEKPIMFMNHQDVVSVSGDWTYPPFSGQIAQGKVWGRGTLDTKGGLFAMLCAANELMQENFVPSNDVYFLSTANEETTGNDADLISKTLKERNVKFEFVLDEGGMIISEPISGAQGKFAMIGIGEKVVANLKFIAKSKGGHASAPPKDSPIVRLGKFVSACENSNIFIPKLSDTTIYMFKKIGSTMKGSMKFVLTNAKVLRPLLQKVLGKISPVAGAMLKTTIAFTMAQGSQSVNVLPQQAWIVGDMRCSHHQGLENSIKAVTELAKKYGIETEITQKGYESAISPINCKAYKLIESTINECFPSVIPVPYVPNSASDCRFMDRVSENCYRFTPFTISPSQLESVHAKDENVDVEVLCDGVDFYKTLIRKY